MQINWKIAVYLKYFFSEEKKCNARYAPFARIEWLMGNGNYSCYIYTESKTAEKGKSEVKLQFRILDLSQNNSSSSRNLSKTVLWPLWQNDRTGQTEIDTELLNFGRVDFQLSPSVNFEDNKKNQDIQFKSAKIETFFRILKYKVRRMHRKLTALRIF